MTLLTLDLGSPCDLSWAQSTVIAHHYLHAPADPRARPMSYVVRLEGQRVGPLVYLSCIS